MYFGDIDEEEYVGISDSENNRRLSVAYELLNSIQNNDNNGSDNDEEEYEGSGDEDYGSDDDEDEDEEGFKMKKKKIKKANKKYGYSNSILNNLFGTIGHCYNSDQLDYNTNDVIVNRYTNNRNIVIGYLNGISDKQDISKLDIKNIVSNCQYDSKILMDQFISIQEITKFFNENIQSSNLLVRLFTIMEHIHFYFNKNTKNEEEFTNFLVKIFFDESPIIRSTLSYYFIYHVYINYGLFVNLIISNTKKLENFFKLSKNEIDYMMTISFGCLTDDESDKNISHPGLITNIKPINQLQLQFINRMGEFFYVNNKSYNKSNFRYYLKEINQPPIPSKMREKNQQQQQTTTHLNDIILINIIHKLIGKITYMKKEVKSSLSDNNETTEYSDSDSNSDSSSGDNNFDDDETDQETDMKRARTLVNFALVSKRFELVVVKAIKTVEWDYDKIKILSNQVNYNSPKCLIKSPPSVQTYNTLIKSTPYCIFDDVCNEITHFQIYCPSIDMWDNDRTSSYKHFDHNSSTNEIFPSPSSFTNLKHLKISAHAVQTHKQYEESMYQRFINYFINKCTGNLESIHIIGDIFNEGEHDFNFIDTLVKLNIKSLKLFKYTFHYNKINPRHERIIQHLQQQSNSFQFQLFSYEKQVTNLKSLGKRFRSEYGDNNSSDNDSDENDSDDNSE